MFGSRAKFVNADDEEVVEDVEPVVVNVVAVVVSKPIVLTTFGSKTVSGLPNTGTWLPILEMSSALVTTLASS